MGGEIVAYPTAETHRSHTEEESERERDSSDTRVSLNPNQSWTKTRQESALSDRHDGTVTDLPDIPLDSYLGLDYYLLTLFYVWRGLRRTMHTRGKSRSCDNYLSIKDSESLDSCIQHALSALYAPFGVTAGTVLWQLFSVVERQYRGDGLRCFVDFLLPAQRILSIIQRETSIRFKGLVLYHEGWPLCIHEKVVVQLAPLHKVRLRQGDFYLQVVPLGRKAAKLVVKCLLGGGQALAEVTVPESMYGSVFTADFLQHVTRERNLQPLHNCLLSTGTAVYRTPWKNVVNPVCVSSAAMLGTTLRGQLGSPCSTHGSTGTLDSRRSSRDSLGSESTASEPLLGHSPEDILIRHQPGSSTRTAAGTQNQESEGRGGGVAYRPSSSRSLSFSTDLSNPSPRRRHPRDSSAFETRRLFRKSYMEALQNPMNLGSSSESILEESGGRSSPSPQQQESLPRRICARGWLGGDESRSGSVSGSPLFRSALQPDNPERRSKSLERTTKASQIRGHRARSSSGGSGGASPKKLMNGCALRFGRIDLEAAFSITERRNSKGDSGIADSPAAPERRISLSGGEDSPSFASSRSSPSQHLPPRRPLLPAARRCPRSSLSSTRSC
uniref:Uncharacterized protein n=1 Tax=Astyanax mexicanus TaxID=7994 RepID=A0A3B1J0U1_ASTMX